MTKERKGNMKSSNFLSKALWTCGMVFALVFYTTDVQGHPLSPNARIFSGSDKSEERLIIFPQITKEFGRPSRDAMTLISSDSFKPFVFASNWKRTPAPTSSTPSPTKSTTKRPAPAPFPFVLVFDDDEITESSHESSDTVYNHNNPEDNNNKRLTEWEEVERFKNSSNALTNVNRFLSNTVTSTECPPNHVYSKRQKRCMRRYAVTNDNSYIFG